MGGWMMDGCVSGWMDGWIDGWMDGWMDGWVDGCMDGWMGGWIDGLMDVSTRAKCELRHWHPHHGNFKPTLLGHKLGCSQSKKVMHYL
jgi:hypothetical protein